MSKELIEKDLEKARLYEESEQFEKATKVYHKLASTVEGEQRLKFFNKAFFTSRKSGSIDLMYEMALFYYENLQAFNLHEKIEELIPTFLEITGRKYDQLKSFKITPAIIEVLQWMIILYKMRDNFDAAFQYSLESGDTYTHLGEDLLQGTYLLGKEEKWEKGLVYLENAILEYQSIRTDKVSIEKILDIKLRRIRYLLFIGRFKDGIKEAELLKEYFDALPDVIKAFDKKILSLKLGKVFASGCLDAVRSKQYDIAEALRITTLGAFKGAHEEKEIPAFLWELAKIFEEQGQDKEFKELTNLSFKQAGESNQLIQDEILSHLESKGQEICSNVINSKLLLVKKGPIEFSNNQGIPYLKTSMDLAHEINKIEYVEKILEFLANYAQDMYLKKLKIRSLDYFEFCAQKWFDLERNDKITEIIIFLDIQFKDLVTQGKLSDAAPHLSSIIKMKSFLGDNSDAGHLAFSFAKAAAEDKKIDLELSFLSKAFESFKISNEIENLEELLTFITDRSDLFYNENEARLLEFIKLGSKITESISPQAQGQYLESIVLNALSNRMIKLGKNILPQAFDVLKNYDQKAAADIYFQAATSLLEIDLETSLEYISYSTEFAKQYESLNEVIERNLNFIMHTALEVSDLELKLLLFKKLNSISEIVNRQENYIEFTFILAQNLSENSQDQHYFTEMVNLLDDSFETYFKLNPKHPKLSEIILWLKEHLAEAYDVKTQSQQMYILGTKILNYLQKLELLNEIIPFYWDIFELFLMADLISISLSLYRETQKTLAKFAESSEIEIRLTQDTVTRLDRQVKPIIQDEKFPEAWDILQGLFQILIETGMDKEAINLYVNNGQLFAPYRLDIAFLMWSEAISLTKKINELDTLKSINQFLSQEILPNYIEQNNSPIVNQIFNFLIKIKSDLGQMEEIFPIQLQAAKFNLAIGDLEKMHEWGQQAFDQSVLREEEANLFEIANMYFGVSRSLLSSDPTIVMTLLNKTATSLKPFKPNGYSFYCTKLGEIYEELYKTPQTQALAQQERTQILKHFQESNMASEEAKFLTTTAKLSFDAGNVREGLDLIAKATKTFQELKDTNSLSEVVSICLKTAARYQIGSSEYESLSQHAALIQDTTTISEEKTQEAFTDLFDGLLDDMTSLMDPKERKKRQKKK